MKINIAIDGPAGAGKSTIARRVAKRFGFIYVDTGALYRAVGLAMLRRGILPSDASAVIPELSNLKVELCFTEQGQRVILNGEDVSDFIRSPEVSMAASKVSAIPEVRTFLFQLQQGLARTNHVIMDGRDIGTVVLPQAQLKVFLTASAEERANRRFAELQACGTPGISYQQVLDEIRIRMNRIPTGQ